MNTTIKSDRAMRMRSHPRQPLPSSWIASIGMAISLTLLIACIACRPNVGTDSEIRLKMGHVYEVKAPTHRYGTSQLQQKLDQAGIGLKVTVFPAAQLGSEEELLEQVVAGELDLAIAGPSFLAMWHPPLGVFDAAYAFRDTDQLLEVARSDLMAEHWEQLRVQYGVRVLDTWAYGTRHITSHQPIRNPQDLRGMRLRLPSTRIWQASGQALGASPMPIAFGEVYMALQQGIADGQENPIPVIHAKGFHEVQKYLNLTGHIESSIQVLIGERVWECLSVQQQHSLVNIIRELGQQIYEGNLEEEKQLLDQWTRDGTLEVVRDVDVEAFRKKAFDFFAVGFPFSPLYVSIRQQELAE